MALQIATARAAVYLFGLIAFLATLQVSPAVACRGPHTRTFPVCEISAPRDDERVTAIYAHGGQGLSSVTLGDDDQVTEVVDIEIEAADKPHYIALSSGKAIIWRFTGRVDTVSRVVVLGSQLSGSAHAGIVGIDPGRILFTKPDLEKFRSIRATTCDSFYSACEISSYFDVSKAGRMELAGPAPARRQRVDQFVERFTAGIIRIPQDGWIEIGIPDSRSSGSATPIGRDEPFKGFFYTKSSQTHERGVIRLAAGDVVSQQKVSDYRTLAGPAGIRQLLESGALVPPGSPQFDAAYQTWDERLSRPYRSQLDPSFSFSYPVEYLLTRPARLPAGLLSPVFLVAEGLDAPQIPRDARGACLFFADHRDLSVDRYSDPRCDRNGLFALRGEHSDLASSTRSLDRKKRWSESEKEECRIFSFQDGSAFFAGIAAKDRPGWGAPGAAIVRRPVDVFIRRPGKIALYLEMWGGPIDWHIKAAPNSELSAVLLGSVDFGNRKDVVHGVDQSVPILQIRWPQAEIRKGSSLAIVRNPCSEFTPTRYAHLGGPAALELDESLKVSAGRGLDRLLRAVNRGDWPPVSADGPRLTFVIE